MKPHLNGSVQNSTSYFSIPKGDISMDRNSANQIKNDNQNNLCLGHFNDCNQNSTASSSNSVPSCEPSIVNNKSEKTSVGDFPQIEKEIDSSLTHDDISNVTDINGNDKGDLKQEDYELLEKLQEANRLIEADSKSLSFSSDGCSKSSSSVSCHKKSSSNHKKSLSTSSLASSSSTSTCHKKSNSVSSVISSLISRQNSISSESECSHKIGIPCSCSQSHSPDILEEGDRELPCDSWSTWREIADNWEQHKDKRPFLKDMVRRGIPPHFRGLIWPLLSGAWDSPEKSNYKNYLRKSSKFEKFIRRDVSRTYPNHDMFKELDGPGQESLFNIIKAYSLLDPEVGYCQGSAFVAGLLLMQMPEEDAFAVFVQVMQKYGLRELYKPSMARIELCIYQLECMIQDKNPLLYQHFQAHGMFASTFATPWFLSLFATSLPLSLSCRVLDIFLLEGMDCIMSLSYAMIEISSQELKMRDMEEMIKLLGKELPQQLEGNPDLLFNTSFKVKFCQKKMKKLEKDYSLIKTKENEDNIERKRLKTENKLLRQRIERLEEETSSLADRLIQDQVKYANQEEELYMLRRKHSLSLQSDADAVLSTSTNPNAVVTGGCVTDAKELQARIDELVNREISYLAEMHDLKMRIAELEKKNLESHGSDVTDLQQQLVLSKLREAEMNTSAKELEQRVIELDKYWQKHQEMMSQGESKPKVQKAKIQVLTEELLSVKLREANMSKELMELKLKVVDLETKNHVNERLIKKLEEEKEAMNDSLSELESSKVTCEDELRSLKRQLSSAESKQQNDELMTKIKDAETSQTVAELKHKIAQLEIQNQELLTAEKLYKGVTQGDSLVDIDTKIEELHQQIVQLRELKKSYHSGRLQNGKSPLNAMKRNYSGESDSDLDDFDAVRYKLKGSMSSLLKADGGLESDLEKLNLPETVHHAYSVTSGSSSVSLEGFMRQSSSDSDFKEDVLAGGFDVVSHEKASRTSSNPDVVLDSVFNDSESVDLPSDFIPVNQSSPASSRNSCSSIKRPDVHKLPVNKFSLEGSCGEQNNLILTVSTLEDPDRTPTNEIENNSVISSRFGFTSRKSNPPSGDVKILPDTYPDILSDPNTLKEIVKNNISSLIAGLDLPGDKAIGSDDPLKLNDIKVATDRSLSLDILSTV